MSALKLFWPLLCLARVALVLNPWYPNWSYIQPDQFFQSTEPIAGDVFDTQVLLVWEFNSTFPLRNIFFPQVIARPVFTLIKAIGLAGNPWIVFTGPRLVITLLSFLCDYSLYKLCQYSGKSSSAISSLVTFSSSYISLTYLTQTFSNSIETILLSLLMTNVFTSIARNHYTTSNSMIIGSLLALGFFNRPTFVLFASAPLLFWGLSSGYDEEEKTFVQMVRTLISRGISLLPSFVMTSMALIIFDTIYYTEQSFEMLDHILNYRFDKLSQSLVITPLNFAKYNTRTANLANHGLHPPYFHMLVSVPLAFSLLGLIAYSDFYSKTKESMKAVLRGSHRRPLNVFQATAILTFVVPLLGFTLIPHQEPRFLIPSLVPLCYLYGHRLTQSKSLFPLWIAINVVLTVFYGFIHQSAVIEGVMGLNQIIKESGQKPIDIVFARHYLPPRHLLDVSKSATNVRIHDLSVLGFPEPLDTTINELKAQNISDFYLMIPSCLTEQLDQLFTRHRLKSNKLVKQYFPYFTAEDIESSLNSFTTSYEGFRKAFSLSVWNVWLH